MPRSWRMREAPGVLTFFAPTDVVDVGLGELAVSANAECTTLAACEELVRVVRTFEPWP